MTGIGKRLIEVEFPLEQVSLDSVHEKNVRHGHVSTLHIWPARRPLAACRAALIATLLPDPGDEGTRKAIYRCLAGEVVGVVKTERRSEEEVDSRKRETVGGVLHWGREGGPDMDWFRGEIRKAHGGRAPKVLDPFAGGGAIPLEAMRLGCEATASDINPVAWFILKCTLDYPQRLAGQTRPIPDFARNDRDFMQSFLKAKGFKGKALAQRLSELGLGKDDESAPPRLIGQVSHPEADLAWQVRAWGGWVLARVREALASRYPTYAEFQALVPGGDPYDKQPLELLTPDEEGKTDATDLNREFSAEYLKDLRKPRWVAKPTVAYLWARTVRCKTCRAELPLLKTCWLCKKVGKRVLLSVRPNADRTGVVFGIERGSASARSRQPVGAGTMSRSGARCPCCSAIMTMEDIRLEGRAGRLGQAITAVAVNGPYGKEYRLPTEEERTAADVPGEDLKALYEQVPFGLPDEPTPRQGPGAARAFSVENYGFDQWSKLFTRRQLLALGMFVRELRRVPGAMDDAPQQWREAVIAYLAPTIGRLADRGSALATWTNDRETVRSTFARFALPIVWDFAESCPLADTTGGYIQAVEWVARVLEHLQNATGEAPEASVVRRSAAAPETGRFDLICTDPPYYDAIPYSDLMDFFHVWLRRALHGILPAADAVFSEPLGPKWEATEEDGELIDDASRFGGDKALSKRNYEDGMARAFQACHAALRSEGRLVLVFANKQPDAWETLVAALIRAGFVVVGSWPIQTEMQTRQRSLASAALSSSIWLVCRKRPAARPGWDAAVLGEMRKNIVQRLRDFWDAGIRGPDFVWAATGPALEAFSKYPVVKKADEPNARMSVPEFLRAVRRMVVDFVVGRVLTQGGDTEAVSGLDDVTTYYLLHRNDFGLELAPSGACILYALSCNLADRDLSDRFGILSRSNSSSGDNQEGNDGADRRATGGNVRLTPWNRRKAKWLGYEGPGGRPVPLIDRVHRLMHLWRAGDEATVNNYVEANGLKRDALFARLLQALIELAPAGKEERTILESLTNHIGAKRDVTASRQRVFVFPGAP